MNSTIHYRQRRFERYSLDAPIRAHLDAGDGFYTQVRGRCRQLGEGGAGAMLTEQLPPGEVVSLELAPSLRVYAAVRYLQGFYHGFEFVLLRDRQREALHQLCDNLAARHPRRPRAGV